MEALVRPTTAYSEPRLLLEWPAQRRRASAWIFSLLLHAVALVALTLAPRSILEPPEGAVRERTVTPLVAPPRELTQKTPNQGRVGREFTLESLLARPRVLVPPGPPAMARTPARVPSLPEPPKVETRALPNTQTPPLGSSLTAPPPPPPRIQAEERPKLAFETPGAPSRPPTRPGGLAPSRGIAPPADSVTEAARSAIHSGGAGIAVGDLDLQGPGGIGPGLNVPPAPGRTASALELLGDPMGVDFKPYLIRILAAVKRNWLAVYPESARLGRVGRVQIQFAIARDGSVPKLVIASTSGTRALDLAAVAGIDSSTPFPPLPNDFKGSQVRLQFTFSYNMK
ncbi:MAG: TonB family protein [Bryobacteraceae bacterium]|jgi:TonB family protein